jgi:hypothetical protein
MECKIITPYFLVVLFSIYFFLVVLMLFFEVSLWLK